jgi:hypothetical protein
MCRVSSELWTGPSLFCFGFAVVEDATMFLLMLSVYRMMQTQQLSRLKIVIRE